MPKHSTVRHLRVGERLDRTNLPSKTLVLNHPWIALFDDIKGENTIVVLVDDDDIIRHIVIEDLREVGLPS